MRSQSLYTQVKRIADYLVCSRGMTRAAAAMWALNTIAPSVASEVKERNLIGGTTAFWAYLRGDDA